MKTFDYVRIREGERDRIMSREEWLALSSIERVRQFLGRRLQFLRAGEVVPVADANGWLQANGSFRKPWLACF